jgi:hypothetical protein
MVVRGSGGGVVVVTRERIHLDPDHRHRRHNTAGEPRTRQNVLRSSSLSLLQIRRKTWRKACWCCRALLRRRSSQPDISRHGVFLYVWFTAHVRSRGRLLNLFEFVSVEVVWPTLPYPWITTPICLLIVFNLYAHYYFVCTVSPGFVEDPRERSAPDSSGPCKSRSVTRAELSGVLELGGPSS